MAKRTSKRTRVDRDFDHYLILGLATVIILATFLFAFTFKIGSPTSNSASASSVVRTK